MIALKIASKLAKITFCFWRKRKEKGTSLRSVTNLLVPPLPI